MIRRFSFALTVICILLASGCGKAEAPNPIVSASEMVTNPVPSTVYIEPSSTPVVPPSDTAPVYSGLTGSYVSLDLWPEGVNVIDVSPNGKYALGKVSDDLMMGVYENHNGIYDHIGNIDLNYTSKFIKPYQYFRAMIAYFISWSPDGESIAFGLPQRIHSSDSDIFTCKLSTQKIVCLTDDGTEGDVKIALGLGSARIDFNPVWVNDGNSITYFSWGSDNCSVRNVSLSGDIKTLAYENDPYYIDYMEYCGGELYYSMLYSEKGQEGFYKLGDDDAIISVAPDDKYKQYLPFYFFVSPDDRHLCLCADILFSSDYPQLKYDTQKLITLYDTVSGDQIELFDENTSIAPISAAFSPDGKSLLVSYYDVEESTDGTGKKLSGTGGLILVDLAGGVNGITALYTGRNEDLPDGMDAPFMRWLPDNSIIFLDYENANAISLSPYQDFPTFEGTGA